MTNESINYQELYEMEKQKRQLYEASLKVIKTFAVMVRDNTSLEFNMDKLISLFDEVESSAANIKVGV